MLLYKFNLDSYFKETKKAYYFIDGVIKYNNFSKKEILDKLDIPESTYRCNRQKDTSKTKYHLIILAELGINNINLIDQNILENTLEILYQGLFYRKVEVIESKQEILDKYIEKNTIITPVLLIFKLLSKMVLTDDFNGKEYLKYLEIIPNGYYTNDFYFISQLIIKLIKKDNDFSSISSCLEENKIHSWLYYMIVAGVNYLNGELYCALIFYSELKQIYIEKFNYDRLIHVRNNIATILNQLDKYELSKKETEGFISDIIFNKPNYKKKVIINYIFSSFMLEHYGDIEEVLTTIDIKPRNYSSAIILILNEIVDMNIGNHHNKMKLLLNESKQSIAYKIIDNMDYRYSLLKNKKERNISEDYLYKIIKKIKNRQYIKKIA